MALTSLQDMKRLVVMTCGWMCLAVPGWGASFDCKKAKTEVEKAVCANPELSKLDDEMARTYREALVRDEGATKQSQKAWLARRDECGSEPVCLISSYETRLAALRGPHAGVFVRGVRYKYDLLDHQSIDSPNRGPTVCQQFLRTLDALGNPMLGCGLGPLPNGPLTRPEWRPIDAWEHRRWIFQINLDGLIRNHRAPTKEGVGKWESAWERRIKQGDYALARTDLVLKNKRRLVLRYSDLTRCPEACDRASCGGMAKYFFLNTDGTEVALEESSSSSAPPGGFGHSPLSTSLTDLLLFNSAAYTVSWDADYFLENMAGPTQFAQPLGANGDVCIFTLLKEKSK